VWGENIKIPPPEGVGIYQVLSGISAQLHCSGGKVCSSALLIQLFRGCYMCGPTLKFCSWYFYYALFTVILPNILAIFYEEKWESSQLKIYF